MTRRECLDKAAECVLQDRASQYGGVEDNFARIAKLWSVYTGTVLDGIDVAMMMALLKVARIRNNKDYSDGYIDLAGYAACGAELAGRAEAYRQSIEEAGEEYKKLRAEAEAKDFKEQAKGEGWEELAMADAEEVEKAFGKPDGGCCQNGNDQPEEPEFKHGDAVEWNGVGSSWLPAVYEREFGDFGHCVVRLPDGRERIVSKADLRRPEANYPDSSPEFQRGDKVEVQMLHDSSTWVSATITAVYRDKDTCEWRYCVDFEDGWAHVTVPSARVRPVSAHKAEGCEDLVQDEESDVERVFGTLKKRPAPEYDAPQTPQELYNRIIANNPATFKAHKPTGEELAEMAEEDAHE